MSSGEDKKKTLWKVYTISSTFSGQMEFGRGLFASGPTSSPALPTAGAAGADWGQSACRRTRAARASRPCLPPSSSPPLMRSLLPISGRANRFPALGSPGALPGHIQKLRPDGLASLPRHSAFPHVPALLSDSTPQHALLPPPLAGRPWGQLECGPPCRRPTPRVVPLGEPPWQFV